MISLTGIRFRYPKATFELLVDALSVSARERIAVVGPSGSGKTTLLNLIAGLTTPQTGSVRVNDIAVNDLNDRRRRTFRAQNIGFIFQDFELIDYLSVRDNILHPFRITDGLKLTKDVRGRAEQLAARVGLAEKLNRLPSALSQGERQRVAICRALAPSPALLLADEATGNLDPENKQLILDLLFDIVAEENATLLAVTHDHELLPRFDRVIDFSDFRRTAVAGPEGSGT